jgi:hypothetical protein
MKIWYIINSLAIGHNKMKASQKITWRSTSIKKLVIMLRFSYSTFNTKDSTKGKKLTWTPRIRRLNSNVRKPRGNDIDPSNLEQIEQHISSIALKILMLQTPPIITKKQITHSKQDQLCVYDLPTKEKTQVGWVVAIGWRAQK